MTSGSVVSCAPGFQATAKRPDSQEAKGGTHDTSHSSSSIVEEAVALFHEPSDLGRLLDPEPKRPGPEDVERDRLAEEGERDDLVCEEDEILMDFDQRIEDGAMEKSVVSVSVGKGEQTTERRGEDARANPCDT